MSRFAALSRPWKALVLCLTAAVIAFGLVTRPAPGPETVSENGGDLALYEAVVGRLRAGEPYEQAVAAEHRALHYPLKPFVAVRPPALAEAIAHLPNNRIADVLLQALAAGVILAWGLRLRTVWPGPLWLAFAVVMMIAGCGSVFGVTGASLLHETWAGLLIALSLAVRTDKRFLAAVLLGLLAAIIRELALPYLAVMAAAALFDRRRVEAAAFAGALILALVPLALHAHALAEVVTAADPPSPGWVKFGGWAFVLAAAQWNLIVTLTIAVAAAVIVPLALLGAAGWKGQLGFRLALLLYGYIAGFMAIGRPDNVYWGLMISPLLGAGLTLAIPALIELGSKRQA